MRPYLVFACTAHDEYLYLKEIFAFATYIAYVLDAEFEVRQDERPFCRPPQGMKCFVNCDGSKVVVAQCDLLEQEAEAEFYVQQLPITCEGAVLEMAQALKKQQRKLGFPPDDNRIKRKLTHHLLEEF